jgi:Flp pilus assembly pilin Flp
MNGMKQLMMKAIVNWQMNGLSRSRQKGQALSEYVIVIGVIALVVIATLVLFRDALIGVFNRIINGLKGV